MVFQDVQNLVNFSPNKPQLLRHFLRHRKDGKTEMIFGLSISGFATEGHLYLGLVDWVTKARHF